MGIATYLGPGCDLLTAKKNELNSWSGYSGTDKTSQEKFFSDMRKQLSVTVEGDTRAQQFLNVLSDSYEARWFHSKPERLKALIGSSAPPAKEALVEFMNHPASDLKLKRYAALLGDMYRKETNIEVADALCESVKSTMKNSDPMEGFKTLVINYINNDFNLAKALEATTETTFSSSGGAGYPVAVRPYTDGTPGGGTVVADTLTPDGRK